MKNHLDFGLVSVLFFYVHAQVRPALKARSSGVERYLDTVEVGGSKPPAPTILFGGQGVN